MHVGPTCIDNDIDISRRPEIDALGEFSRECIVILAKTLGDNPRAIHDRCLETLRFEIKDLDREVLTDAEQPYWCQLIKKMGFADCNWVRREMLAFKVTHKTLPTGGFRLGITIDGKVGSGYYDKIRDNAYKPMTTDFNDYLERYAERFRLELRNYLLTGRP